MGDLFSRNLLVNGWAPGPNPNTIFFRSEKGVTDEGLAHETFHLGKDFGHLEIQRAWDLTENESDGTNITDKFKEECL